MPMTPITPTGPMKMYIGRRPSRVQPPPRPAAVAPTKPLAPLSQVPPDAMLALHSAAAAASSSLVQHAPYMSARQLGSPCTPWNKHTAASFMYSDNAYESHFPSSAIEYYAAICSSIAQTPNCVTGRCLLTDINGMCSHLMSLQCCVQMTSQHRDEFQQNPHAMMSDGDFLRMFRLVLYVCKTSCSEPLSNDGSKHYMHEILTLRGAVSMSLSTTTQERTEHAQIVVESVSRGFSASAVYVEPPALRCQLPTTFCDAHMVCVRGPFLNGKRDIQSVLQRVRSVCAATVNIVLMGPLPLFDFYVYNDAQADRDPLMRCIAYVSEVVHVLNFRVAPRVFVQCDPEDTLYGALAFYPVPVHVAIAEQGFHGARGVKHVRFPGFNPCVYEILQRRGRATGRVRSPTDIAVVVACTALLAPGVGAEESPEGARGCILRSLHAQAAQHSVQPVQIEMACRAQLATMEGESIQGPLLHVPPIIGACIVPALRDEEMMLPLGGIDVVLCPVQCMMKEAARMCEEQWRVRVSVQQEASSAICVRSHVGSMDLTYVAVREGEIVCVYSPQCIMTIGWLQPRASGEQ